MSFFSQVQQIARIEAGFFVRFPRLLVATLVVALIPALYTLIYLSSVWDPASHTESLAVGLVNLDQNVDYQGQSFNVGNEVVLRLKARHTFGFQDSLDEAAVRQAVREGKLAFALVIPSDFSSNALPGASAGAGKLVVYTSEGNNYQSAHLARRFADDLGHAVNDSLNERRWALVIRTAAGSQRSVERLRQGIVELQSGSHELEAGTARAAEGARTVRTAAKAVEGGVAELTSGVMQMGTGLRTMEAAQPKPGDLHRLKAGTETLAAGHMELGSGLAELQTGAHRLVDGVVSFRSDASDNWLVPGKVVEGLDTVHSGAKQLDVGLQTAVNAQHKLTDGSKSLSQAVAALTGGLHTLGNGVHTMVNKLPDDNSLKSLADGASQLRAGSGALADANLKIRAGTQRLASGVDLLMASLPVSLQRIEGSAKGMAQSVEPQVEVDAAVQNQGSSFAPNVIPAALWLGAGIIAFLVHVRVMPNHAESFSRPAQFAGKMVVPAIIVLLQALSVFLIVAFVLRINMLHPWAFVATLVAASLAFLSIVFALTRALGDAGKAIAMLFLAVQLSSSGGVLPVELSGGLFARISPWLPMTWVVKAIKASLFGAYDDAWQTPVLLIGLVVLLSTVFACLWGKWRYVDPNSVRPAIDF
jgi:putative membrane protein